MRTYLENLINEKTGIDMHTEIQVEGASGTNYMDLAVLVEAILAAPKTEQFAIRNTLVKIDFYNGDVMHFFRHLAQAIAI